MPSDRLLTVCLAAARENRLFSGLDRSEIRACLTHPATVLRTVASGHLLATALPDGSLCLGLLCQGQARVSKQVAEERQIVISTLQVGSLFGAASLFTQESQAPNAVQAVTSCTVALFPEPLLEDWFRQDFRLTRNYLSYLVSRIRFLNHRIEGFTAGSAESRLAHWLHDRLPPGQGGGTVVLGTSMLALAQTLDISRASLYRAVETLEQQGLLQRCGKSMVVPDGERLLAVP